VGRESKYKDSTAFNSNLFTREFEIFFSVFLNNLRLVYDSLDETSRKEILSALNEIHELNLEVKSSKSEQRAVFTQSNIWLNQFLIDFIFHEFKRPQLSNIEQIMDLFFFFITKQFVAKDLILLFMKFYEEFVNQSKYRPVLITISIYSFTKLSENCLQAFIVPIFFELCKPSQSVQSESMTTFLKYVIWIGDFADIQEFAKKSVSISLKSFSNEVL
jgi:hypothetical protein